MFFRKGIPLNYHCSFESILEVKIIPCMSKYLGSQVCDPGNKKEVQDGLRKKLESQLQSWKGKLLSEAIRRFLLHSILTSSLVYKQSTIKLSKWYIDWCNSIINNFWLSGYDQKMKLKHKACDNINLPKDLGDLGFKDLATFKDALLAKSF